MTSYAVRIASELSLNEKQVAVTIALLSEGATIPFIARYRKELTGSLDEVQIAAIRDREKQLDELDKRRDVIIKSLVDLGKLTPELKKSLEEADTLSKVEDIYLPYRPKRKTRATVAVEKGLKPLADLLFEQKDIDSNQEAMTFINEELGVKSATEALSGARDIIAERVTETPECRDKIRRLFLEKGQFITRVIKGKEEAGQKYKDYFEWTEDVKTAPSHRVLAMRRGEKEQILSLDIAPEEDAAIEIINRHFIIASNKASSEVKTAIIDGYKRLLKPSMETEVRLLTRKKADEDAIAVFTQNARELLLAAPLGQKRTLALDPGFRTGCKLVCLDEQGKLLENTAIFPHTGAGGRTEAEKTLRHLVKKYNIEAIAIGNGTASRETEQFVQSLQLNDIIMVMVNESGASIYSASEVARDEFPDHDVTVRGAVSIGRRLMDPLAELVKIDPKSIGVGQYQHDVDQTKLQSALDDTVISCVNAVGVELNTASKEILSYISGLGPQLAKNIVEYRNANGAFRTRKDLMKVTRLGEKAFEQAAGFLRISNGADPLDASSVHPERYKLVQHIADDLNCTVKDLLTDPKKRSQIKPEKYVSGDVGLPTLKDILAELAKPGRDPRQQFETFNFDDSVKEISDLKIGMRLPGIVTNVTNFGAFVDVGVHQDGLVHISQLSSSFISNPNDIVKVHQKVMVTVTEVDAQRKRIALSMVNGEPAKKVQGKKKQDTDFGSKLAALRNKFS